MELQIIYNALQHPYKPSGIAGLLNDILVLEERLKTPDRQSEYFRMGTQNHREHLAKLLDEYDRIRGEFNRYTTSDFRNEILAQQQMILKHAELTPLIARNLARIGCQRVIHRMEEMIRIKRIVHQLPDVKSLKLMPELLEALLSYR